MTKIEWAHVTWNSVLGCTKREGPALNTAKLARRPTPFLSQDDRHVADLKTRRRRHNEGRIDRCRRARGRWCEMLAVFCPRAMQQFDPPLRFCSLGRSHARVEQCGLIGKSAPRVGHNAAVAERRLERTGDRPRRTEGAARRVRRHLRTLAVPRGRCRGGCAWRWNALALLRRGELNQPSTFKGLLIDGTGV